MFKFITNLCLSYLEKRVRYDVEVNPTTRDFLFASISRLREYLNAI